nr:hypothetical protein Itr_chr06CG19120 [Ipomoea trifida]
MGRLRPHHHKTRSSPGQSPRPSALHQEKIRFRYDADPQGGNPADMEEGDRAGRYRAQVQLLRREITGNLLRRGNPVPAPNRSSIPDSIRSVVERRGVGRGDVVSATSEGYV